MKLKIGYFYRNELNLYGDTGNIEILAKRAILRGLAVEVIDIHLTTDMSSTFLDSFNVIFMGGGPDSGQKDIYKDLLMNKGPYVKDYIERGGVGLFICGSYQLLGNYYKSGDASVLEGLGVFDLYTEHFGTNKPRCIGNIAATICPKLLTDPIFSSVNNIGSTIVGFENHGGRTTLKDTSLCLGTVTKGFGNNGIDKTEGIYYKNVFGSYMHGPFLSKNPHIADYLIAKSLNLPTLDKLDDSLIKKAHTAALLLK